VSDRDPDGAGTGSAGGDARPGGASGDAWDPEGTDLARALVARARAAARGRPGPVGGTASGSARRLRAGRRRPVTDSAWSGSTADDRDPQVLGTALDRLVGERGWGEELAVHAAIARWDLVVGPDLAAHVRPQHYADGVLSVRADSTAWATQVRLLAPVLVRRLNEEIGDGTVTRVDVAGPHAPSWRKGPRVVRGRGPRDTYG
jgi:predicted nucleic acid-binding Zn ribbon protein